MLPRLDILPRIVRSPVEICFGTKPEPGAESRPLENTSPVPIAATVALEMIGPIPGTVIDRVAAGILIGQRLDLERDGVDALIEATPVGQPGPR